MILKKVVFALTFKHFTAPPIKNAYSSALMPHSTSALPLTANAASKELTSCQDSVACASIQDNTSTWSVKHVLV